MKPQYFDKIIISVKNVSGIKDKLLANMQASVSGMVTEVLQLEAPLSFLEGQALNQYTCMVRS